MTVTLTNGFAIGDKIELLATFTTSAKPAGTYELVKKYHRSLGDYPGQESTSGYDIEVRFVVGRSYEAPEMGLSIPIMTSIAAIALIGIRKSIFTKIK
jgi:hypothetical protein